jgi:hypothetical protein
MNYIRGIKLCNISVEKGAEHNKINAEVLMDTHMIGELINDGWCDEYYIEFLEENYKREFEDRMKKYYKRKKINCFNYEMFIKELLFINKEYNSVKNNRLNCEQLTFLWN